jgi:diguanylate cyclase (GGDEF)-like protein
MESIRQFAAAVRAGIVRHRVKIFDLGFIVIALAVAALFAFEVDVFENESRVSRHQETFELDEILVLTVLVVTAVLAYTWRRAREHARENARRLAAEQEVLTLALHDPLTGLPNRRQFDAALRSALTQPPRAPEAHAVFLLDLNGFKKINDVHGHPVGDHVLIAVGARLLRAVREGDLVARLGGDEFVVLARNLAGAEGATTIAQRIIDCLVPPIAVDGVRHTVGTAIGVALSPHDGEEAGELMRKADVALYRAKTERASAMRFFEVEMDARLRERDTLERALAAGVEGGEFFLRFQPTRVEEGRIGGFEALPRWRHPSLGELEPDRFEPVAQEAGLLPALTGSLLRQACAAAAGWPAGVRLAFPLPAGLLTDATFGLRMLAVLGETGLSPNRLDLDIDEGALIRDPDAGEGLLTPLRAAGVRIVAAHFGTGYSDLQKLHKLRLDGIKIDPSFVNAMVDDRQAAVMVKALIGIGQGLDLSIVADGVSSEAQRAALAAQGCEQGQGALFGEAVSAEDAAALVAPAQRRVRRG